MSCYEGLEGLEETSIQLDQELPEGYEVVERRDNPGYALEIEQIGQKLPLTTENGLSHLLAYIGEVKWGYDFDVRMAQKVRAENFLKERGLIDSDGSLQVEIPQELEILFENGYEAISGGESFEVAEEDEVEVAQAVKEAEKEFLPAEYISEELSVSKIRAGHVLRYWQREYGMDADRFRRSNNRGDRWRIGLLKEEGCEDETSVIEDVLEKQDTT